MSNRAKSAASLPIREVVRSYLKTKHRMLPVSIARLSRLARATHPGLALPDSLLEDLIAREALSAGRSIHFDGKHAWPEFSVAAPSRPFSGRSTIDRERAPASPSSRSFPVSAPLPSPEPSLVDDVV